MAAISRSKPQISKVLLRIPATIHLELKTTAAAEGLSLNEYCVRRLAAPGDLWDASGARGLVVDRARRMFGARLAGVIAIGSWARGQAAADSDLDVLIAVDPDVLLRRDLYRTWDQEPLTSGGRAVDVHFVHLLGSGAQPGAVWCEAALDGIVWHDRDGAVAARLAAVRHAIAEGRLVRGFAHGQPYWKGAA